MVAVTTYRPGNCREVFPTVKILIVVSVLVLMWAAAAVKVTEPEKAPTSSVTFNRDVYDRLAAGLSVRDAKDLLGEPMEELDGASKVNPSDRMKTLYWKDKSGRVFQAQFLNGLLIRKMDGRADR